jgi:hypothetical protein
MNFNNMQTRASWGAVAPKYRRSADIDGPLTVHWVGSGVKWRNVTPTYEARMNWMRNRLKAIQGFHMGPRGWSDIGYSFAVDPWGLHIWGLRGLNVSQAAQGTSVGNKTSHSILVATGLGDGAVDPACLQLVDKFADYLADAEGCKNLVIGHRDWKSTTCPGDELYGSLSDLNLDPAVDGTGEKVADPDHLDDVLAIFNLKGGYAVVDSAGKVAVFGDATNYGDASGIDLNEPIVDAAATPSGLGYYLVAGDGGIFTYGDATYLGSMGGTTLVSPIIAIEAEVGGYMMVAGDGGIFAFGIDYLGRPVVS